MMRASSTPEKNQSETRVRLLEAAERLFAEHGLDNVSMRQINREAGQRNTASIHYYFGSRYAVIEAVLERRMSVINEQRLTLIRELKSAGRHDDLAALVALYVRPLAAQMGSRSGSNAYIRFLAQAYASSEIDILKVARGRWDQSLEELAKLMRGCLNDLPTSVFRERVLNVFRGVVYVLADRERDILTARERPDRMSIDTLIDDLIATQTAALSAPYHKHK